MTGSSASIFFRLRRLARLRVARLLAFVLAIVLIAGNAAAAAAPVAAAEHGGHSMAQDASAGSHCTPEQEKSAQAHGQTTHHGQGCPCCAGKTCACVNACSALATPAISSPIVLPERHATTALPTPVYASFSARLLRPPIA